MFLLYVLAMGLASFWFFVVKRLPTESSVIPRTKTEWMAQATKEALAVVGGGGGGGGGGVVAVDPLMTDLCEARFVTSMDAGGRVYGTIQLGGSEVRMADEKYQG